LGWSRKSVYNYKDLASRPLADYYAEAEKRKKQRLTIMTCLGFFKEPKGRTTHQQDECDKRPTTASDAIPQNADNLEGNPPTAEQTPDGAAPVIPISQPLDQPFVLPDEDDPALELLKQAAVIHSWEWVLDVASAMAIAEMELEHASN
jgi:hypothetical protein